MYSELNHPCGKKNILENWENYEIICTFQEKEELTAEEEMGLTGATAEDMECEFIRKVTETEIVNSKIQCF